MRTVGLPSRVAVARAMALGWITPRVSASTNHAWNCRNGSGSKSSSLRAGMTERVPFGP